MFTLHISDFERTSIPLSAFVILYGDTKKLFGCLIVELFSHFGDMAVLAQKYSGNGFRVTSCGVVFCSFDTDLCH